MVNKIHQNQVKKTKRNWPLGLEFVKSRLFFARFDSLDLNYQFCSTVSDSHKRYPGQQKFMYK